MKQIDSRFYKGVYILTDGISNEETDTCRMQVTNSIECLNTESTKEIETRVRFSSI